MTRKMMIVVVLVLNSITAVFADRVKYERTWPVHSYFFLNPRGIAVDSTGCVYVVDTGKNRIQKYSATGALICEWGGYGTGNGQFDSPFGIAVDASGNVYIADTSNNRIQKFDSSGTYISQWGGCGSGDSQFSVPCAIAVDGASNVYVADTSNNRVQKFNVEANSNITGYVRKPDDSGIVGLTVMLQSDSGISESYVTQGAGYYQFTDLPAGRYVVAPVCANSDGVSVSVKYPSGCSALDFGELMTGESRTLTCEVRGAFPDCYVFNPSSITVDSTVNYQLDYKHLFFTGTPADVTVVGTLVSSSDWLTVSPSTFTLSKNEDTVFVSVTVEKSAFNKTGGRISGFIEMITPTGSERIEVSFTATCVLVRPNPVRLSSIRPSSQDGLITFYGDGIVPGQTTIRIYTLNGELSATLSAGETSPFTQKCEVAWHPGNLSPGIYIYTYESPKERGVGKFTCVGNEKGGK